MHSVETAFELSEMATYGIAAGDSEPLGILTIHDGTLSAFVQPATGERAEGSLERLELPAEVDGLAGAAEGQPVTLQTDPVLADLLVVAPTRQAAVPLESAVGRDDAGGSHVGRTDHAAGHGGSRH